MKWLILAAAALLVIMGLCLQIAFSNQVKSAPANPFRVKELNFIFLHGGGGTACDMQLLCDSILKQLPHYIANYEKTSLNVKVEVDTLNRCYPNDVDIETWANNIVDSIDKYLPNKRNLILIGHSAGGKAALYAAGKNIGGLAAKVAMVVTINAPVRSLENYYITGGGSVSSYCRARWLLSDRGICNSIANYDSSGDGSLVGYKRHWLAFISGENAPSSKQFDYGGIDAFPRDIDDGSIPISAQYSDGADVVYYGEHGHSDFKLLSEVADYIAAETIRYLFGESINCSVYAKGGSFEHRADWFLGTDYWQDLVGEALASSGHVWHMNESYTEWQEWEDVVGDCFPGDKRSHYEVSKVRSALFFTSIKELRWLNLDNPQDCRLYLRTSAAPRNYVQVDWKIYRQDLLPEGKERDRYEVEIISGTPLTQIREVSWMTDDPRDLRLRIWSQAESPYQWFKTQWRVYYEESRQQKVINEIPFQESLEITSQIDELLLSGENCCP